MEPPPVGIEKRWAPGRRNRGERGIEFLQGLMRNLENYRDLSVKHKFHINLKP
jgi:hypothetical protein